MSGQYLLVRSEARYDDISLVGGDALCRSNSLSAEPWLDLAATVLARDARTLAIGPSDLLPGMRSASLTPSSSLCMTMWVRQHALR